MYTSPILLVEDSADDQELIVQSLQRQNIENPVLIASDGVEALDYLFGTGEHAESGPLRPTVVLLDMQMPGLGGLDVLERIRNRPETSHIPVVMLTSSDEAQDICRSYDLGANSYVRKPIDFVAFADAVGKLGVYWAGINQSWPGATPG